MNIEFLEIIRGDIKRCEDAQKTNKGTRALYQALIGKYNGIYEGLVKTYPLLEKHVLVVMNVIIDQS